MAAKTEKQWESIDVMQLESSREKLGLTKNGMANALGVTNSTYHNWIKGKTIPSRKQQDAMLEQINALTSAGIQAPAPSKRAGHNGGDHDGEGEAEGEVEGEAEGEGEEEVHPAVRPAGTPRNSPGTSRTATPHSKSQNVPYDTAAVVRLTEAYIQAHPEKPEVEDIVNFVTRIREVV